MNGKKIIHINEGWEFLQKGIRKITASLDGGSRPEYTSDEFMMLYTTVFNMCCQHQPYDYAEQLYRNYRQVYIEYINSTVLPSIRVLNGDIMLRELVKRWESHKILTKWLSYVFSYLDRQFVPDKRTTLHEVGVTFFRDLVYQEVSAEARNTVIFLIDREREGEEIDRALVWNAVGIFVEMGMGEMDLYMHDFEQTMLEHTASYYYRKASSWILEHSSMNYLMKVEECLRLEKERASHYLHPTTEKKLVKKVELALFGICSNELLEGLFPRYTHT